MAAAAASHLELETLVLDACHHCGLAGADGRDNAGVRLLACTQGRGGEWGDAWMPCALYACRGRAAGR